MITIAYLCITDGTYKRTEAIRRPERKCTPTIKLVGSTSMNEGFQKFDKDTELAIRLILRWFAIRDARPTSLELRVHDKEKTSMTIIGLYGDKRVITVQYCYDKPLKPGEVAHV